jgi:hypothetical protein
LKLFLELREKGIKENDGGGEFKYDMFDIRTFVNATVYFQHNNKRKKGIH